MHILPSLPYDYNALEPYIDEATMHLHHEKHHQAYIDNLNKALEGYPDLQSKTIEELLKGIDLVDEKIRQTVINHGGGHANHSFFWQVMSPKGGGKPGGDLGSAIDSTFGSFDTFKEEFTKKAMGIFGSGWAFLVLTPDKKMTLRRKSFQNSPLMEGSTPLLGLDVWEHAYYIKYQNRRAEYVEAFWNIVNWKKVEEDFLKLK